MSSTPCFWLEPVNQVRVSLRRWRRVAPCLNGDRVCTAKTPILQVEPGPTVQWARNDWRWPTRCASCGFPFNASDYHRTMHEPLYRRQDTGAVMTLSEAPPGAMWAVNGPQGPDGLSVCLLLPDDTVWHVDRTPASNARPWKRIGSLPNITVRPGVVTATGWQGSVTRGAIITTDEEDPSAEASHTDEPQHFMEKANDD